LRRNIKPIPIIKISIAGLASGLKLLPPIEAVCQFAHIRHTKISATINKRKPRIRNFHILTAPAHLLHVLWRKNI
jgi:hypothetical protein